MQYKSLLLQSLQSNLRLQHLSRRTETAYIYWTKRFVRFFGLRHPTELGYHAAGGADPGEVVRVVDHLQGISRLVGLLLYGSGLRLTECLMLRIKMWIWSAGS